LPYVLVNYAVFLGIHLEEDFVSGGSFVLGVFVFLE
jgi:hypothetical protein